MNRQWTKEEIWEWYKNHDWISGFNFLPSTSTGGMRYVLQEYEHDLAYQEAAKEIALAASVGLNSVRALLPFEVWQHQHDTFFKNLDQFLALLDSYGMTFMPILFNDCLASKEFYQEPILGPQPEPLPGFFGGHDNSFDSASQIGEGASIGYSVFDEPGMDEVAEQYVREMAQRYGNDPRIIIWNVWNEMGNSERGTKSLPLMKKVFQWLREEDVSQPLTSEIWGADATENKYFDWLHRPGFYGDADRESVALSDIVTFHFYGDYMHSKKFIKFLKQFGRPLINTEWMHRPFGSYIETHLPLWKREKIGSYFFGFVNGKPQMHIVWGFIKPYLFVDQGLWMHDIFHNDFTPYDPDEIAVLKECNADKKIF